MDSKKLQDLLKGVTLHNKDIAARTRRAVYLEKVESLREEAKPLSIQVKTDSQEGLTLQHNVSGILLLQNVTYEEAREALARLEMRPDHSLDIDLRETSA